jgi:hypothetical protein
VTKLSEDVFVRFFVRPLFDKVLKSNTPVTWAESDQCFRDHRSMCIHHEGVTKRAGRHCGEHLFIDDSRHPDHDSLAARLTV